MLRAKRLIARLIVVDCVGDDSLHHGAPWHVCDKFGGKSGPVPMGLAANCCRDQAITQRPVTRCSSCNFPPHNFATRNTFYHDTPRHQFLWPNQSIEEADLSDQRLVVGILDPYGEQPTICATEITGGYKRDGDGDDDGAGCMMYGVPWLFVAV